MTIEALDSDTKLDADLDLKVLVIQHKEMSASIRRLQESADKLADEIQARMGTNTLIVADGRPIASYRPTRRFAGARFLREQPELGKFYMRQVTKEELDVDLIRTTNLSLYQQYQVKSFINGWEGIGG